MKASIFGWAVVLVLAPFSVAEKLPTLDDLLDRRIKLNEDYRDEFVKDAEESSYSKELKPLERDLGQGWVDHLKYVKKSKDLKLKEQVIRLEILTEMTGIYYELEYAENLLEKASLGGQLQKWKRELALLDEIVERDAKTEGKQPNAGSEKSSKSE